MQLVLLRAEPRRAQRETRRQLYPRYRVHGGDSHGGRFGLLRLVICWQRGGHAVRRRHGEVALETSFCVNKRKLEREASNHVVAVMLKVSTYQGRKPLLPGRWMHREAGALLPPHDTTIPRAPPPQQPRWWTEPGWPGLARGPG